MPNWSVIADVSTTLQTFLQSRMAVVAPDNPPEITVNDLDPGFNPDGLALSLFLFDVAEDPSARNKPRLRMTDPPAIKKPPLALLLRYLVTPWGGTAIARQQLLGRTLQVLYDNAILSGPHLVGEELANTSEALKITLAPLTLEERTRIWEAINPQFRLSVAYDVRVVYLDAELESGGRLVINRTLDAGRLEALR